VCENRVLRRIYIWPTHGYKIRRIFRISRRVELTAVWAQIYSEELQ
jgi:hypothetical protein